MKKKNYTTPAVKVIAVTMNRTLMVSGTTDPWNASSNPDLWNDEQDNIFSN